MQSLSKTRNWLNQTIFNKKKSNVRLNGTRRRKTKPRNSTHHSWTCSRELKLLIKLTKKQNRTFLLAIHQHWQRRPSSIQAHSPVQRMRFFRRDICIRDNTKTLPRQFSLRQLKLPKQLHGFCFPQKGTELNKPANELPQLPFSSRTRSEEITRLHQSIPQANSACT